MACFGKDKTTQETKQTVTVSPQEEELNKLLLDQTKTLLPGQTELAGTQQDVLQGVLSGGVGLPEEFTKLFAGITPEMTNELAQEAVADIAPQFQKSGILDSGVAASISARTAGDIRRQVAETNLTRLMNLLNTGLGYGGQQQQIGTQASGVLGSQLAGLRSTSGNTTVTAMNPFLKSFQTSLGEGLASWSSPKTWMGIK